MQSNGIAFKFLSKELENNFEIALAVGKSKRIFLGILPVVLKNNFEIVLAAVKKKGYSLIDAS